MSRVGEDMRGPAAFVDRDRLQSRIDAMARFGAFGESGVNRQALSGEDVAARAAFVSWGRSLGLQPFSDPLANLFLRLEGADTAAAPIVIGSHLDSQPTGGRFDGAFGVLAALEAVEAIQAGGFRPTRPIEIVAWTNEEGSRFAPGMMGSAGFAGLRPLEAILALVDADGTSVRDALEQVFAEERDIPQRPLGFVPAAYVEPHIEQGPVLEQAGRIIGLVTGIQGKRTFRVTVTGAEAHAGTEPRARRRDALISAIAMVRALDELTRDDADVVRFTVGRFEISPNAPSVVPARVVFSIDLRHPDPDVLRHLGDQVIPTCVERAGACDVEAVELLNNPPVTFSAAIRQRLADIAGELDLSFEEIASGAGHDAVHLVSLCPTAMIFIPCRGGVSHNPDEYAEPAHMHAGAAVLAEAALWLADRSDEELKGMKQ